MIIIAAKLLRLWPRLGVFKALLSLCSLSSELLSQQKLSFRDGFEHAGKLPLFGGGAQKEEIHFQLDAYQQGGPRNLLRNITILHTNSESDRRKSDSKSG
jgi:hypothetical protein